MPASIHLSIHPTKKVGAMSEHAMTWAERRWAFLGGMTAGLIVGPPTLCVFFTYCKKPG